MDSAAPAHAQPRRRLWRVILYGTPLLIAALVLLHPYSRQALFGPKIHDVPFSWWQDEVRAGADPDVRDGVGRRVARFLGFRVEPQLPGTIPNETELLPVFVSLMHDPNPHVRTHIAYRLSVIASGRDELQSPEAFDSLLQMLDDEAPDVRAAAARFAGGVRPKQESAVGPLAKLLDDPEPTVQIAAAPALAAVNGPDPRTPAILRNAMKSSAPLTRATALQCLGDIVARQEPASFADVAAWAESDPSPDVRRMAINALPHYGAKAVPALLPHLKAPDPKTRARAAHALGLLGPASKDAIPTLQRFLASDDLSLRDAAGQALARIDPKRFANPISGTSDKPD